MKKSPERCRWTNLNNPLYIDYHDNEWGVPVHDDGKLFELFILETFQAGLSWECILNKRDAFREAFDGFDVQKIAGCGEEKITALMDNRNIIRNRLKIKAAISNSRKFIELQKEYGSFDNCIWSFTKGETIYEEYSERTTSPLSDEVSRILKKRGFSFVGSTTVYSLLQACGVINGHGRECFKFKENSNKR
jgi:DNA-3-methyladenine glycosylase I